MTNACCDVCGALADFGCSQCAAAGIDLFFCSKEHQKLVWFAHKLVCGQENYRSPPLTPPEQDIITKVIASMTRQARYRGVTKGIVVKSAGPVGAPISLDSDTLSRILSVIGPGGPLSGNIVGSALLDFMRGTAAQSQASPLAGVPKSPVLPPFYTLGWLTLYALLVRRGGQDEPTELVSAAVQLTERVWYSEYQHTVLILAAVLHQRRIAPHKVAAFAEDSRAFVRKAGERITAKFTRYIDSELKVSLVQLCTSLEALPAL
ncbi:hypothetical protein JCM10450v2_003489 [Rhodotorula kratochvilovae]